MKDYIHTNNLENSTFTLAKTSGRAFVYLNILLFILNILMGKGIAKLIKAAEIPLMISFFTLIDIEYS